MMTGRRSSTFALLALPVLGCSTVSNVVGTVTGEKQQREMRLKVAETRSEVMRLSDSYSTKVLQATAGIAADTPEARLAVLDYEIDQVTAAYQIATAPNPLANAIDLAVLTTLSGAVVKDYWIPEVWGESGRPLLRAYETLEPQVWFVVSGFVDPDQEKQLRDIIAQYRESNPHLKQAAFIRMADIAQARAKDKGGLGTPSELLGSIGLNIFGGLDPAVQQVEQARVLAERALFYAQRSPRLLDMQAQLLTLQLSSQPASEKLLEDTTRISKSAERVAVTASQLPEVIDRQREAAIDQVMTALAEQESRSRALLADVKQTLDAGAGAASSVNDAIRSANALLASVNKPPPPGTPPPPPGKPFDIAEYTQALNELGKSAQDLEALVSSLDQSVPRVAALAETVTGKATGEVRALVDYAFRRALALVLVLVGAVLLAAITYRWAAVRLARARA